MAQKPFLDSVRDTVRRGMRVIARGVNRISGGHITPNHITIVGLIMHIPIMWAIIGGQYILAAILLVIFGLFDTLDGELARLQGRASTSGAILDASTDRIKEAMIYTSFVYIYSAQANALAASAAVVALSGSMLVSYVKSKGETALVAQRIQVDSGDANKILANGLARFEVRMFILIVALLTHQILPAVVILAVLAWSTALYRFVLISKSM